jgi:hypothetical protein
MESCGCLLPPPPDQPEPRHRRHEHRQRCGNGSRRWGLYLGTWAGGQRLRHEITDIVVVIVVAFRALFAGFGAAVVKSEQNSIFVFG